MSDVQTKDQLLATLRAERARWDALLAEVGEERLTVPGVAGDWSVKDLLGHLAAYQRYWGAQARGATTGVPPTPRDLFDTDAVPERYATEDEQNAAIHALYAPLPPAAVLAKWREASDLLTDSVAALTEEDVITPGRFAWAGDRPLAEAMAGDTYRHAAEHAADVRAWLDRTGP
jgi:uncharacterized protein (TIGR03083 family)